MSVEPVLPRYESFDYREEAGVVQLSLNRPAKRNCLGAAFWFELPAALQRAAHSPSARCVLLEAQGPVFCAGIDLALLQELGGLGAGADGPRRADQLRRTVLSLQAAITALERCPLPVLAAVQGACIGGGLDLICAADLRLAEAGTRFTPMETDLGFVPDLGTVQRLATTLPPAVVAQWLYTCRPLGGAEAQAVGFVSQCFDDAQALATQALAMAREIARKPPTAVRGLKETLRFTRAHGVTAGLDFVAAWQGGMFPGADLEQCFAARREGGAAQFAPWPTAVPFGPDRAPAPES